MACRGTALLYLLLHILHWSTPFHLSPLYISTDSEKRNWNCRNGKSPCTHQRTVGNKKDFPAVSRHDPHCLSVVFPEAIRPIETP
jgi:hypothetical protein